MRQALASTRLTGLVAAMVVLTVTTLSAEPRVVDLPIRGGVLPAGQRVIRVQQGDAVTLRWTSDRALTVHLHGYDIEQRITPGTTATMTFAARATGRFSIETHASEGHRASTVAYLEVHPR
jgi:FtsP/CotA-like multicopper oxidase with cupredoxin domain